jgi:excisionase family DNA binding protein
LARHLPTDEVFLTTEAVLEYLQVNLRTIYRLIKAGKIPAVRVGRQWRFRKRDIDAWLDSQRAHGSQPTPPIATPAQSGSSPRNGHPRVLIVDDEASIRDLLCKTLQLAEYEVETAQDAGSALSLLRRDSASERFDLVITDLKMPGMDGLTLAKEVKQLKSNLPVIIITGFSSEKAAIDAVNVGVAGYLTKPFRIPQVLEAAAKALGAPAA